MLYNVSLIPPYPAQVLFMSVIKKSVFFFNNMHRLLLAAFAMAVSCGAPDNGRQLQHAREPAAATTSQEYLVVSGDSVLLPAFAVEAQLSKAAIEKLREKRETVIVNARFSGIPKDTASKEFREWGEMLVKSHSIELDTAYTARFEGIRFPKKLYDLLLEKDIRVMVHIYSGRRTTTDNLLDAGILSGKMSAVKGRTLQLPGKLISEADSRQ